MSFTKASFQVHSILQQLITTPYIIDIKKNCLVPNLKYFSRSNAKLVFVLAVVIEFLLEPLFFIHLAYLLISGIHNPINLKLDQISYLSLNVGILSITNASNFIIITYHHLTQQLISEVCRLGNGIHSTSNVKIGKLKLKEAFIHSFYASVLTMALACALTPFVFDWEPIQRIFGSSFGVKLLAACTYGFVGIYDGSLLASTFLLLFTLLENMESYTNKYLGTSKQLKPETFTMTYKYFRMFQTISIIANSIYSELFTFIIGVGVLAASVSTFVTLTMWNKLSFVMYVVAPAFTFCSYMVVMLIIPYANVPNKNIAIFFDLWKLQVLKKIDRQVLRSCPTAVGFKVGPYGSVTASLGIRICDDITQNAISLILL